MILEFEVLYRVAPAAPLQTVIIHATDEKHVEAKVKETLPAGLDHCVIRALQPHLYANQTTFNREEAAVFMCCSPSKIDALMAIGDLPKAKGGRPIFTKRMLLGAIAKTMQVNLEEVA